jgi:hypothetical protein
MNVIYNSPNYHVVEYPGHGFEVIAKHAAKGAYLSGETATRFRDYLTQAAAEDASIEVVDEYLGNFDEFMNQPAIYH